ncbi:MAG TPA: zinc-binding dehydrogenase [Gemmatimonadaceae bacterium]|nr:zinc-binding dehydrogenase [Gemmatimonadaceae bacterium]
MKAIRFAAPIPTYLATLAAGKVSHRFLVGPHACTTYGDVEPPRLPGDQWVRVRTTLGGICGSDLSIVTLAASPSTSPFSSFPFVLGHELVGVVTETGAGVRAVRAGDRVTANPLLCCESRAIAPVCAPCAAGEHGRCERFTDGALPPGMLIGTTRGLGGGWGEQFVAHESQLLRLPDGLADEAAVLIEPFACAVRAVRANLPPPGARVLVVGAGSIGLLATAAVRALAPAARVTVLARHDFQGEHARRFGAANVIRARRRYLEDLAAAGGTRLLQPILGRPIGVGGFDLTIVCVSGARAMEDAMRVTAAGGTIVLLGNSAAMAGLDWTPLWLKELTVRGSVYYGHAHAGAGRSDFAEAAELIAGGKADVRPLLTHVFPLASYREALATAMDKRGEGSIKVAFRP